MRQWRSHFSGRDYQNVFLEIWWQLTLKCLVAILYVGVLSFLLQNSIYMLELNLTFCKLSLIFFFAFSEKWYCYKWTLQTFAKQASVALNVTHDMPNCVSFSFSVYVSLKKKSNGEQGRTHLNTYNEMYLQLQMQYFEFFIICLC